MRSFWAQLDVQQTHEGLGVSWIELMILFQLRTEFWLPYDLNKGGVVLDILDRPVQVAPLLRSFRLMTFEMFKRYYPDRLDDLRANEGPGQRLSPLGTHTSVNALSYMVYVDQSEERRIAEALLQMGGSKPGSGDLLVHGKLWRIMRPINFKCPPMWRPRHCCNMYCDGSKSKPAHRTLRCP